MLKESVDYSDRFIDIDDWCQLSRVSGFVLDCICLNVGLGIVHVAVMRAELPAASRVHDAPARHRLASHKGLESLRMGSINQGDVSLVNAFTQTITLCIRCVTYYSCLKLTHHFM